MTTDEALAVIDAQIAMLVRPQFQDALASVVDDYIAQIEYSFDNACSPDGELWDDIVYRSVPPPPLQLTGAMRESVIADAHGATIDETSLTTDGAGMVPYAAQMDEGHDYGYAHDVSWVSRYATLYKRKISWHPGRPFLGFGQTTIVAAADHGVECLNDQLLGAWD